MQHDSCVVLLADCLCNTRQEELSEDLSVMLLNQTIMEGWEAVGGCWCGMALRPTSGSCC